MTASTTNRIAFQGGFGANSDMALRNMFPDMEPLPCRHLRGCVHRAQQGEADLAIDPDREHHSRPRRDIHSFAARIADAHCRRIFHADPFPADGRLPGVRPPRKSARYTAMSHAVGQCRKVVRANGWKAVVAGDTAGAARLVSQSNRPLRWRHWRPRFGRRALRASPSCRKNVPRTPKPMSPASSCCRARRKSRRARSLGEVVVNHFCLPGAQHSRRALQGDGRISPPTAST